MTSWCSIRPDLNIQLVSGTIPCQSGVQFGSLYAVDPLKGHVFDHMPAAPIGARAEH
jgi:hypothetical protein